MNKLDDSITKSSFLDTTCGISSKNMIKRIGNRFSERRKTWKEKQHKKG